MNTHRTWILVGLSVWALICVALALMVLPELSGGIADIPSHWWSAIPVMGLGSALIAIVAVVFSSRRDHRSPDISRS
jgi:putative solute:sodium symporter small subunit